MKNRKKEQKPETSIHKLEISRNDCWIRALKDEALCQNPDKDGWLERLIYSMYKYFEPERVVDGEIRGIEFDEFLKDFGIPRRKFDRWVIRYPLLASAYEDVKKTHIAARRKVKTMNFNMHFLSGYRDMHAYDYTWAKDVDSYHAKLKEMKEMYDAITIGHKAFPATQEMAAWLDKKKKETDV